MRTKSPAGAKFRKQFNIRLHDKHRRMLARLSRARTAKVGLPVTGADIVRELIENANERLTKEKSDDN